jgi:hypothetical protein
MTALIAIAAVALVAWFAAGTIWNVRRGHAVMRWMQEGLPLVGERTTVRWLGSSAVEMVIREGKGPFASVTLIIFMEARDTPWMWALGRLRGRRDLLIARGVLKRAPKLECEVLEVGSWSAREAQSRVPREWAQENVGGLAIHGASAEARAFADSLLEHATSAGLIIKRLSVRRNEPHFQIHVGLPGDGKPADGFFTAVRGLAERVLA